MHEKTDNLTEEDYLIESLGTILEQYDLPFGNENLIEEATIEPLIEDIPTELEVLKQINQPPWIMEQLDWAKKNTSYSSQEVLNVLIQIAPLTLKTQFCEIFKEYLICLDNDLDFQSLSINALFKKLPNDKYRKAYAEFEPLRLDVNYYTTEQFSIVLDKLGEEHLYLFHITEKILTKPMLLPEYQCLLVEALGYKNFIPNALENPKCERLFWDKFSDRLFCTEEEQYLIICLTKELDSLKESPEKRACALGMLGALYVFTAHSYIDVPKKGLEFITEAIALGNSNAMCNYGSYLELLPDRISNSIELYFQAASLNNAPALNRLGRLYLDGKVVTQDYAKALEFFHQATQLNHEYAIFNLADMHYRGLGVDINYTKASELFRKSYQLASGYSTCFQQCMSNLQKMQKNHPDDVSVQYHCTMALEPHKINALFTSHAPKVISECIFYDSLLSNKQKYQLFSACYLVETPFFEELLDYSQKNQEQALAFCQDALNYLQEAEESGTD